MTTSLLQFDNISLQFPHTEKSILSNLDYEVAKNDFIIILGSNGSGKSSLLKLLTRQYKHTTGHIHFNNQSILQHSDQALASQIKMLTQNYHESLFTSLTVYENYQLINKNHALTSAQQRQFLQDYLRKFNPNLPTKLDQTVIGLSGGEKQTLALALTVLYPPLLLLLDEHTSALDPHAAETIMKLTNDIVAEYNITCLLTTHDLTIANRYGNRILALKNGCIQHAVENNAKNTIDQQTLLAACY